MFTTGACVLIFVIGLAGNFYNTQDRAHYDVMSEEDRIAILALHIRQDLKLLVFALGGVIIMLGVIADRLH